MTLLDILLLLFIALWAGFALWRMLSGRSRGCCGNCARCAGCDGCMRKSGKDRK